MHWQGFCWLPSKCECQFQLSSSNLRTSADAAVAAKESHRRALRDALGGRFLPIFTTVALLWCSNLHICISHIQVCCSQKPGCAVFPGFTPFITHCHPSPSQCHTQPFPVLANCEGSSPRCYLCKLSEGAFRTILIIDPHFYTGALKTFCLSHFTHPCIDWGLYPVAS